MSFYTILQSLNSLNVNKLLINKKISIENFFKIVKFDIENNNNKKQQCIWDWYKIDRYLVHKSDSNILCIGKSKLKKILKKNKFIDYEMIRDDDDYNSFFFCFRKTRFVKLLNIINNENTNEIKVIISLLDDIILKYREYENLYMIKTLEKIDLSLTGLLSDSRMEINRAEKYRDKLEQFFSHHEYATHRHLHPIDLNTVDSSSTTVTCHKFLPSFSKNLPFTAPQWSTFMNATSATFAIDASDGYKLMKPVIKSPSSSFTTGGNYKLMKPVAKASPSSNSQHIKKNASEINQSPDYANI